MSAKFNLDDIYDKNLNFLIGSGASYGLFPTLALEIGSDAGETNTIETLATSFLKNPKDPLYTLLFMHYYKTCIEPVLIFDLEYSKSNADHQKVITEYEKFIETLVTVLQRKKNNKSCNIFTTNYDECFTHVSDNIFQKGNIDFILNDGARGFNRRFLKAKNFKSFVYQTGAFELHRTEVPQINLIHLHGSAFWYKDNENICIDYKKSVEDRLIDSNLNKNLTKFSNTLKDRTKKIDDIPSIKMSVNERNKFWESYNKIPIVNPTKWKFYETVFEEHYYQMLRFLSYELEKPNSIFIIFGFSFADEHILNLVKRSLSNPSLQLFICCFNQPELFSMKEKFAGFKNVQYISAENPLTFLEFNKQVFTLTPFNADSVKDEAGDDL